jgi:ribonuclease P protein component
VRVLGNAEEFKRVYERGAKQISRSFVVFALSNGTAESRFGLTTPRKLGKAHDRNRIRRRVREIIRTEGGNVPAGFDWVINPRRSALNRPFTDLKTELIGLLGSAL